MMILMNKMKKKKRIDWINDTKDHISHLNIEDFYHKRQKLLLRVKM